MSLDYFNITPVTYIILHSLEKSIHFEYREWRSKSKLQEERNKAQRPVINGGPPSRAPAGPIIVQPPARPLLLPPTIAPVSFTAGQGLHRAIYRRNEFKGPEGEGRGGDQEKVAIPPSHGRVKKALLLLLLLLLRSRDNESSTSFRSSGRGACSTVTLHRHHRPLLRGSLDDWGSVWIDENCRSGCFYAVSWPNSSGHCDIIQRWKLFKLIIKHDMFVWKTKNYQNFIWTILPFNWIPTIFVFLSNPLIAFNQIVLHLVYLLLLLSPPLCLYYRRIHVHAHAWAGQVSTRSKGSGKARTNVSNIPCEQTLARLPVQRVDPNETSPPHGFQHGRKGIEEATVSLERCLQIT